MSCEGLAVFAIRLLQSASDTTLRSVTATFHSESTRVGVRGNVSGATGVGASARFCFMGARMSQLEAFRVLLVDDDVSLLESMESILAEHFVVRCCASGYEALRVLDSEPFHVACADWQMPGMDGVAFFQAVARRGLSVLPCCILITGHASNLLGRVPYEDRKMLGMLRKPFRAEQLIERVNQFASVAQLKRSNAALKAAMMGESK